MAKLFSPSQRLGATLFLALALGSGSAGATLIERVVAVVGERAILLSDLRERAQPFLLQIYQSVPPGAQRNAAISQLNKGLIEKLVDEEIEQRAAIQAKVSVTAREVEEAIERVAGQNGLTVARLLAEAKKTGLDETAYREELRRQLLQTKLINVRLQGRIRVSEDDLRSHYRRLVLEERERLTFQAAWIRFATPPGATAAQAAAVRKQAEQVARSARTSDFAWLARRYSTDAATRDAGGVMAIRQLAEVPPTIGRVLGTLEVGEVSTVITVPGGFAIFKLHTREESSLPSYDEARNELSQRVYLEKMNHARRAWLDNLRRQQHVEIRL